jgi:hypothetical protein
VILHMTVYLSRSTYLNVAETGASVPYDSCLLLYSFLPSFTPSFSCVTLDAGTVPWHQLKPARGNHVCVFITAVPITKLFAWGEGDSGTMIRTRPATLFPHPRAANCNGSQWDEQGTVRSTKMSSNVSLLACVCLLLQYLFQSCSRGGRGIVKDMCYGGRVTLAW